MNEFFRLTVLQVVLLVLRIQVSQMLVVGFQCRHSLQSRLVSTRKTCRFSNENEQPETEASDSLFDQAPAVSTFSSQLEQGAFNPLNYQQATTSSRNTNLSSAPISLRSMRMSQVTNDLLNNLDDTPAMRKILEDNRDFLLEPLEDEESVAGTGSIYTPDMSRIERYQAYRKSVNERLASSQNEKAKAVLTAMRDFVLEFENAKPL